MHDDQDMSQVMNAKMEESQSHAGRSRGTMVHGKDHLKVDSLFNNPP